MGNTLYSFKPPTTTFENVCIQCQRKFERTFRSGICPSCHQTFLGATKHPFLEPTKKA